MISLDIINTRIPDTTTGIRTVLPSTAAIVSISSIRRTRRTRSKNLSSLQILSWIYSLILLFSSSFLLIDICQAFSPTTTSILSTTMSMNGNLKMSSNNNNNSNKNKKYRNNRKKPIINKGGNFVQGNMNGNNNKQISNNNQNVDNNNKKRKQKQTVAIIGGGIAGLSCAKQLTTTTTMTTRTTKMIAPGFKESSHGDDEQQDVQELSSEYEYEYDVTVFDTGRLRPGGRCSNRQSGDVPKEDDEIEYPILSKYKFDHAAQLISVPFQQKESSSHDGSGSTIFDDFYRQIDEWKNNGIVKEFSPGSVCRIDRQGKLQDLTKRAAETDGVSFYHGTDGMGSIPIEMTKLRRYELKQDVWVSPSNGVRYQKESRQWKLQAKGKTLGYFDYLIIAHNGKCADRIMSNTPARDVHSLLRVNFSPTVPISGGTRMTLNSLYSLTICVPANSALSNALPVPFVCGFVDNTHPDLKMITCQTRKYPNDNNNGDDYEVWTILSSAKFAKKYKAPQEFLPSEIIDEVSRLLINAVEESIIRPNLSSTSSSNTMNKEGNDDDDDDSSTLELDVVDRRLQLWGAAVPLNVWNDKKVQQQQQQQQQQRTRTQGQQRQTKNQNQRNGTNGGSNGSSASTATVMTKPKSATTSTDELSSSCTPTGFILDAQYKVGVCGDWLLEPSIAGAWTSGQKLAQHMLQHPDESAGLPRRTGRQKNDTQNERNSNNNNNNGENNHQSGLGPKKEHESTSNTQATVIGGFERSTGATRLGIASLPTK